MRHRKQTLFPLTYSCLGARMVTSILISTQQGKSSNYLSLSPYGKD